MNEGSAIGESKLCRRSAMPPHNQQHTNSLEEMHQHGRTRNYTRFANASQRQSTLGSTGAIARRTWRPRMLLHYRTTPGRLRLHSLLCSTVPSTTTVASLLSLRTAYAVCRLGAARQEVVCCRSSRSAWQRRSLAPLTLKPTRQQGLPGPCPHLRLLITSCNSIGPKSQEQAPPANEPHRPRDRLGVSRAPVGLMELITEGAPKNSVRESRAALAAREKFLWFI